MKLIKRKLIFRCHIFFSGLLVVNTYCREYKNPAVFLTLLVQQKDCRNQSTAFSLGI